MCEEQAICAICGQPAGPMEEGFRNAKVSHQACAMEVCYVERGVDPASCTSTDKSGKEDASFSYAERYKEACAKRTEQAGPCKGWTVTDPRRCYRPVVVLAYNEAQAKLFGLAMMYGCPLKSVDDEQVKQALAELTVKSL